MGISYMLTLSVDENSKLVVSPFQLDVWEVFWSLPVQIPNINNDSFCTIGKPFVNEMKGLIIST